MAEDLTYSPHRVLFKKKKKFKKQASYGEKSN